MAAMSLLLCRHTRDTFISLPLQNQGQNIRIIPSVYTSECQKLYATLSNRVNSTMPPMLPPFCNTRFHRINPLITFIYQKQSNKDRDTICHVEFGKISRNNEIVLNLLIGFYEICYIVFERLSGTFLLHLIAWLVTSNAVWQAFRGSKHTFRIIDIV